MRFKSFNGLNFSVNSREISDLVAAWLILSVAFANLFRSLTFEGVAVSVATVGLGFLLHELAHKVVAQNYGLKAVFHANYSMLGFAVLASFAGFIFAAPGAVYTEGSRTRKQQTAISVAGPVTNIVLALAFLAVPGPIGSFGTSINGWLALFNMMPFGGLDGQDIYRYNKPVYILTVAVSAGIVFLL